MFLREGGEGVYFLRTSLPRSCILCSKCLAGSMRARWMHGEGVGGSGTFLGRGSSGFCFRFNVTPFRRRWLPGAGARVLANATE